MKYAWSGLSGVIIMMLYVAALVIKKVHNIIGGARRHDVPYEKLKIER